MNAWVGDLFGVLDNFKPWCGNRFIMEREAPLSMGAPQPRLASRRIPRSPGWLLDGFPVSPSLTFSHLASYPPYGWGFKRIEGCSPENI